MSGAQFAFGDCELFVVRSYQNQVRSGGHFSLLGLANRRLEEAINCTDGEQAAKIIQHALGIELDDVANYVFPKTWPEDREQRARIIGEWLQTEARFLA